MLFLCISEQQLAYFVNVTAFSHSLQGKVMCACLRVLRGQDKIYSKHHNEQHLTAISLDYTFPSNPLPSTINN